MIKRDLKDNFQISISGQDTWYDMNVPGSAMETFCKEGILPDPYPDYKFPMTIYSDKRLPKKGELRDNFCNFDRNRIQLFNEGKVYDSLTDAGLFQEFSNSFLVIVERKENK